MATPHTFLLELGTEELPAGFLQQFMAEAVDKLQTTLSERNLELKPEQIRVESTPRRLMVQLNGLAETLPDAEETLKGPPAKIAVGADGQLTKAGEGFLKKNGLTESDVTQEALEPGGEVYLIARRSVPGANLKEQLGTWVLELISNWQGPRFMRWGANKQLFPRPIRWLCAFWDEAPLPLELSLGRDVLKAEPITRGHRVLSAGPVNISSAQAYEQELADNARVMIDTTKRRQRIKAALEAKAEAKGGEVLWDHDTEALLDELVHITEWPTVMVGRFEERFLELPVSVLTTVMRAHQRYVPVYEANSKQLKPLFLFVSNADPQAETTIVAGNERVLAARFEDAAFFYKEDLEIPLIDRLEQLKGITFQKGLGTVYDKTIRLENLSLKIGQALEKYNPKIHFSGNELIRAARLSKCDLVTQLVFEFTELQGEVGAFIAEKQGESDYICNAIEDHYKPRYSGEAFYGDSISYFQENIISVVLALADKIDTLVAVFSQKKTKMPSGSRDPLGLRRLIKGILVILQESKYKISFLEILQSAYNELNELPEFDWVETRKSIEDFSLQRLRFWLKDDCGKSPDVVEAVLAGTSSPFDNVHQTLTKANWTQILKEDFNREDLIEPAKRIDKILGKQTNYEVTLESLNRKVLIDKCELELLSKVEEIFALEDPVDQSEKLRNLHQPITAFFDAVLVNDPDPAIKQARLDLLSIIQQLYWQRYGKLSLLVLPSSADLVKV